MHRLYVRPNRISHILMEYIDPISSLTIDNWDESFVAVFGRTADIAVRIYKERLDCNSYETNLAWTNPTRIWSVSKSSCSSRLPWEWEKYSIIYKIHNQVPRQESRHLFRWTFMSLEIDRARRPLPSSSDEFIEQSICVRRPSPSLSHVVENCALNSTARRVSNLIKTAI